MNCANSVPGACFNRFPEGENVYGRRNLKAKPWKNSRFSHRAGTRRIRGKSRDGVVLRRAEVDINWRGCPLHYVADLPQVKSR